jgi:hypothetical protein
MPRVFAQSVKVGDWNRVRSRANYDYRDRIGADLVAGHFG